MPREYCVQRFVSITAVYQFEKIAINLMGPLPETPTGNTNLLIVCDNFSKWVELLALPDIRTETVAEHPKSRVAIARTALLVCCQMESNTLFSRNAVALGNQGRYAIGWPPCRRPILVFHFRRTGRFLPSDGCFLGLVVMDSDDVGKPSPKRSKHSNAEYFCAVPHCSNRSESGGSLHFHRFPANASRSKAWTHAIRRETGENFIVTSNTRVCSVHFRSADYRTVGRLSGDARQRVRLENDAVPSVFAWKPLSRATLEREARAEARKARETAAAERTVVKVTTDPVEVSVEAEIEVSSASPEEVRSRTPDEPVEVRSSPLAEPEKFNLAIPCPRHWTTTISFDGCICIVRLELLIGLRSWRRRMRCC